MAREITHSVSHQLRLGLSWNRLWYVVSDKNNQLLTSGGSDISSFNELEQLLAEHPVLSGIYSSCKLLSLSPKFIIAPEKIAREDHNFDLFKLSNKAHIEERIFRDHHLETIEIQYAAQRQYIHLLKQRYPSIEIEHVASFFHKRISLLTVRDQIGQIQLALNDATIFLTCSLDNVLLLCNSYPVNSLEDIFYYTMLAIEQLGLDPASTALNLYCNHYQDQPLEDLFKNYVAHIETMPGAEQDNFIETMVACE